MTTRATPDDVGCWIDGHWGQYGIARMVEIASENGYEDDELVSIARRHLNAMAPSDLPEITDDEHEILSDACDEVEAWLNEHVAPADHYFEWSDGEFFLRAEETVYYLLEHAPTGCEAVSSLYDWSTNYDAGKGPFALFLDLIGWSEDEARRADLLAQGRLARVRRALEAGRRAQRVHGRST
jgi:hypothetical protein